MFWAVTAAVAASGMVTTGLAFHQISLLGERGLSPVQAAANFVPQTGAAITATVAMGVLAFGRERLGGYGPTLTLLLAVPLAAALTAVTARVPDDVLRRRVQCRLANEPGTITS